MYLRKRSLESAYRKSCKQCYEKYLNVFQLLTLRETCTFLPNLHFFILHFKTKLLVVLKKCLQQEGDQLSLRCWEVLTIYKMEYNIKWCLG